MDQVALNPFCPETRSLWTDTGMESRGGAPGVTESITMCLLTKWDEERQKQRSRAEMDQRKRWTRENKAKSLQSPREPGRQCC